MTECVRKLLRKNRSGRAAASGSIPKLFSHHPPTPERVQKAQEEIATDPARREMSTLSPPRSSIS